MSLIRRRLLDDTIKKTASGNPIAVQSVARMRPGIKIFGRSTQVGTPSPDHPVPIVNAGEGGEITVYISGANLLDIDHIDFRPSESTGLTAQLLDDGTIQVSGTPVSAHATVCSDDLSLPAGTYFISGGEIADGKLYAQIMIETGDTTAYYVNKSFTITGEEDMICFSVQTGSGVSYVDDYKIKPMLNFGDTALPWGPYRELQDLPIQIPNGLPGIPVDSGGNYTDENGQQWICNEIDLKRGKYVQRVKRARLMGDVGDDEVSMGRYWINVKGIFGTIASIRNPIITSVARTIEPINSGAQGQIFQYSIGVVWYCTDYFSTKEELETFLEENDVTIIGHLSEPIETDLTAEEIAAYKALHTYSPTTTIMNNEKAGMKLTYKTRKGLETDA